MIRLRLLFSLMLATTAATVMADPVAFEFVRVGNAGNAPDPQAGSGAVDYTYAISRTEVTNAQYVSFLNAVDPSAANTLDLFNSEMAGNFGGIELQAGNDEGSRYVAQTGREQNPVTFVSFFDAMRFTNWLHNGQGAADTEAGVYSLGTGVSESRASDARFWIPSEDEWYKAAYHDAEGGKSGGYFEYATGGDSVPVSDQPIDSPAGVNYYNTDSVANGFNDGYAVTGSTTFPSSISPFTDVGAYVDATSPYGAYDMNGNVWEWQEDLASFSFRRRRGGAWNSPASFLQSDIGIDSLPTLESSFLGFRVATVLPDLDGDYNADGLVDAADYVVWRNANGTSLPNADGNNDGSVDQADYDVWAANYGAVVDVFTHPVAEPPAAIPEPATQLLVLATVVAFLRVPFRR